MTFCVRAGCDVVAIETVAEETTLREYILSKVCAGGREDKEDPFYVVDLGCLLELHQEWEKALPSVTPFYAVKCNEDPALLKTLAALGTGFDCASKNEIKAILDLGVTPDRIIYANPCKQASHIRYAAKKGVRLMTFDNEMELYKVKSHFPNARLVLRIRADDPAAICQLGIKFGCSVEEAYRLLGTARDLALDVVGVSFHVGSGCQTPEAYTMALEMSAMVFQFAEKNGFHFSLLDIGGGFPGTKDSQELFSRVTEAINGGVEKYFSDSPNLNIIAEPGRYFACSTHTLAVSVISKRALGDHAHSDPAHSDSKSFMYYVNDGIYGSFNCIMFDHVTPTPTLVRDPTSLPHHPTSLWGPTCDGLDKICDTTLPELSLGEWLFFDNMGAYTVSAASTFNGFLRPRTYYYIRKSIREKFQKLHLVQLDCEDGDHGNSVTQNSVDQMIVITSLRPQHMVEVY